MSLMNRAGGRGAVRASGSVMPTGPEQQVPPRTDCGHWDGHLGNHPQPAGAGACGGRVGESYVHGKYIVGNDSYFDVIFFRKSSSGYVSVSKGC